MSYRCSSCLQKKSLIEEPAAEILRRNNNLQIDENHLKHYSSILTIKENRLKEQEFLLENERNALNIVKEEIYLERLEIERQKQIMSSANSNIKAEKQSLEKQFQLMEKKFQDVSKMLSDFENQKLNLEKSLKDNIIKNIEDRENDLSIKEKEVNWLQDELENKAKQFERIFIEKTGVFEVIKQELKNKQKIINKKKGKIADLKQALDGLKTSASSEANKQEVLLNEISKREENLKIKSQELDYTTAKIQEEKAYLEDLRKSLQKEKEIIDQDIINSQRVCIEKTYQAQLLEEKSKSRIHQAELKEKKLEEMIRKLQEEEKKIEERWKTVENAQKVYYEFNDLKEKYIILQRNFAAQQVELSEFKYKHSDMSLRMNGEIRKRIFSLERKENDLNKIDKELKKEREKINKSVLIIKKTTTDLENQKDEQINEHKRLDELSREIKSTSPQQHNIRNPYPKNSIANSTNIKNSSLKRVLVCDIPISKDQNIS